MKVIRTSDTELWRIEKTGAWSIPYYCDPCSVDGKQMMMCYAACGNITPDIQKEIAEMLEGAIIKTQGVTHLIEYQTFCSLFVKCPGVNPAYYLYQDPKDAHKDPVTLSIHDHVPDQDYSDEFLREAWQRTRIADYSVYTAVYKSIIQEIGRYLLHRLKPVDLGWFIVGAVPFRENWKQNMLVRHPQLKANLEHHKVSSSFYQTCTEEVSAMHNSEMMAVKPTKAVGGRAQHIWSWTLEIVPKKAWEDYSERTEHARHDHYAGGTYVKMWVTIIRTVFPFIFRCLKNFVQKTAIPAGQLVQCGVGRVPRIMPYVPPNKIRPAFVDNDPFNLVTPDSHYDLFDAAGEPSIPISDANLQKLRSVRVKPKGMRLSRRSLGGLIDESTD